MKFIRVEGPTLLNVENIVAAWEHNNLYTVVRATDHRLYNYNGTLSQFSEEVQG